MKRQRLELVTCVSLVAYAAIVLLGQAVHWIPGLGCHCHTGGAISRSVATANAALAIEARFTPSSDNGVFQRSASHTRIDRGTVIVSDRHCPVCHWFSMSQQQAQPVQLAVEVAALSSSRLPVCEVRHLTHGSILPRGPPLLLASPYIL